MRYCLAALLVVLLAGCVPASATSPSVAMQSIESTRQAAGQQASIDATVAVATQQALETEMAMSDQRAVLEVTAQALAIEQARINQAHADELAALDLQLQALVYEERQAGIPLTQVAAGATATAVMAESMERVDRQRQAEVISILIPVLICVFGFALIGVIVYGLYIFIRVWNDKQRVIETSLGPVLLLSAGTWRSLERLEDEIEDAPVIDAKAKPQRVWTSPNGGTAFSSPGARPSPIDNHTLVRNFLRNAVQEAGPLSQQLPRWDAMGWTSDQWQRATALLKARDLVYSKEREGTWINTDWYLSIGALSAAVHMKKERF